MEPKKKILLVSNGFYPEISPRSFRATELAKEFARKGHEVTVYTKYRDLDYREFSNENNISVRMWRRNRFPSVPESKYKIPGLLGRAISMLLAMLLEYPAIEDMFKVKKALKDENGYDLMISFAVPYPVHWGVARSRSKKHPIADVWIADCGDPYMGCKTDRFKKLFYFKYVEKWWSRKTDYITIPVENARSAYYSEFHNKIKVIPQGFKLTPIAKPVEKVKNNVPTFAYTGTFIPGKRDPRKFMDYLVELDRPFHFIIYTNNAFLITKYIDLLNSKLTINEYIPRVKLLEELSQMDFLVNFDNNTGVQVPSKLIDYKLTGRPVYNIRAEFDKEIFTEFLEGDYRRAFKIDDLSQYDIINVTSQFTSLIS